MVSWAALNTFALPVAIYLLRNGAGYYRSWTSRNTTDTPPKPASPRARLALNILFAVACLILTSTLPYFSPRNIFAETKTRLQTSNDVIFARLAGSRPLTPQDELLSLKLASKEARLLYFKYGPSVLAGCVFCAAHDPTSYLTYALPALAAPHVLHMAVLGLVTSAGLFGAESARWRTPATAAAVALAVADLWFTAAYDHRANTQAVGTRDINFFFWRMRLLRGVGMVAIDGLLGLATWLAATNRLFRAPPSVDARLDDAAKALEVLNFRLLAAGNVRNAVVRDRELAGKTARYWAQQIAADAGMHEEREVVDGMREALTRIDRGIGLQQQPVGERAQIQADAVITLVQQLP